ncbi:hypothetical protein SEVIR_4G160526v4 [Setaria viridis]
MDARSIAVIAMLSESSLPCSLSLALFTIQTSSLMCPAELLVPHPEPAAQLMRTFMPPAATGAAARTHGIPNFQVIQRRGKGVGI